MIAGSASVGCAEGDNSGKRQRLASAFAASPEEGRDAGGVGLEERSGVVSHSHLEPKRRHRPSKKREGSEEEKIDEEDGEADYCTHVLCTDRRRCHQCLKRKSYITPVHIAIT